MYKYVYIQLKPLDSSKNQDLHRALWANLRCTQESKNQRVHLGFLDARVRMVGGTRAYTYLSRFDIFKQVSAWKLTLSGEWWGISLRTWKTAL